MNLRGCKALLTLQKKFKQPKYGHLSLPTFTLIAALSASYFNQIKLPFTQNNVIYL